MTAFHTAFPDYPIRSMPTIPEGFKDTSWHNDACPSFEDAERGLQLWCDFPEAADRAHPKSPRFAVFFTSNSDADVRRLGDKPAIEAEEWAEVEAFLATADEARDKAINRALAEDMANAMHDLSIAAGNILRLYESEPERANRIQPDETAEVFPASIDEWCLSIAALKDAWTAKAKDAAK